MISLVHYHNEHVVGMGGDSSCLSHGMCCALPGTCSVSLCRCTRFVCIVITQMGYDFGVPLPGGFHGLENPDTNTHVIYSNVNCNGTENSIWDCDMTVDSGSSSGYCCNTCYDRSVAVYCTRFC